MEELIPILIWGLAITGQLGHPATDPRLREWAGLGPPPDAGD